MEKTELMQMVKERTMITFPRDYTITQARSLYDCIGIKRIAKKKLLNSFNLDEYDMFHFELFGLIAYISSNSSRVYYFVKNPYDIKL